MDYKEKLKAIINSNKTPFVDIDTFLKYFPELKESEDERIWIINYLNDKILNSTIIAEKENLKRAISWLEKQGAHTALSKDEQNKLAKGVLRSCAFSFINYIDSHRYEGKMDVSIGECKDIENAFQNAMWNRLHRYYCKYIENQGEQNTIDKIQIGKKYKCIASPRYSTFVKGLIYKPEDEFLCSLMNFCPDCFEPIEDVEQKHTDKVEPKFKVGDWVCHTVYKKPLLIVEDSGEGDFRTEPKSIITAKEFIEGVFRLWTIQDAKDGDVLAYKNDIVIFKENNYNPKDKSGCMFVYCSCNNFYEIGGINPTDYKPATKEQRDLLFQKMKEAGYEWDAEHKQLKKIEQNPAWSEEDSPYYDDICELLINILHSESRNYNMEAIKKDLDWLKSLKDRVQLQNITYYNPYKEVVESIAEMCKHYDTASHSGLRDFYDNVKIKCKDAKEYDSLYPQNHWKPSDEQIEALDEVYKTHGANNVCRRVLFNLMNDLKKLKE